MRPDRPTGDDRDPAAADRMTALERRARRLLLLYPAAYRGDRGDEIIGTLLEATPEGRPWPRVRDVRALAVGGLNARAAQNRQRTTSANLRVAIMAGLATYLSFSVGSYLDGVVQMFRPNFVHASGWAYWFPAVMALLEGATVVLAWTARRVVVLAAALAESSAVVAFALGPGGALSMFPARLPQVLSVIGIALLAPRAGHPSRHWLWLPGVVAILAPLAWLAEISGWFGYSVLPSTLGVQLLAVAAFAACGVLWVGIDARLIVAALTCLAVYGLELPLAEASSGFADLGSLVFFLGVLAIAAPAIWTLRRQSARPVR